ncbi:MAG TPA: diguanylate cyclase [Steroidobacteraceae bacterium]|nr:diguanylate cyclase [Steroidobacteraceae bacterium]
MGVNRIPGDLPDLPYARQLKAGFPWLTFDAELEPVFRQSALAERWPHIRVNLCLAIVANVAATLVQASVLGEALNRLTGMLHLLVIIPVLFACLGATFSQRRDRTFPPIMLTAAIVMGLAVVAVQLAAALGGASIVFPALVLCAVFVYFMCGLVFYQALAANLVVTLAYIGASTALQVPAREFGYQVVSSLIANAFCASAAYMTEKTSRTRFLEAALLSEMVARDGLTGIQNRRMFDQHIQRAWNQAVRDGQRVAVLLVDIDCFKDYNDRYGHQAGDECLRAVAVSLSQCARRPLDFVARYGGEEFAVVLYEASREYVAEVLTRIQRSVAELNIPHEASRVASRLTVSIGAAFILPGASRTHEGLIQLADEALYSAKEQGRNCVVVMDGADYHTLRTGRFERRTGLRASSTG